MHSNFSTHDLQEGVTLFRGFLGNGLLTFNAYLIKGDKAALLHTGPIEMISVPSEMHLWDGFMVYDHKDRTLFSNDFLARIKLYVYKIKGNCAIA